MANFKSNINCELVLGIGCHTVLIKALYCSCLLYVAPTKLKGYCLGKT